MSSLLLAAALHGALNLDVVVIEGVEGGPVILDLTARWMGAKPTQEWYTSPAEGLSVRLPASVPHLHRPVPPCFSGGVYLFGGVPEPLTIKPGDVFTIRVHLHLDYSAHFAAGDLPVIVRCRLPGRWDQPVFLEKTVYVRLTPLTKTQADALHAVVERTLRDRPVTAEDRGQLPVNHYLTPLIHRFLHTRHTEFARTAFHILAAQPGGGWEGELKRFLYSVCSRAQVHDMYLSHLEEKRRGGVRWVFEDWRASRSRLHQLPGAVASAATSVEWTYLPLITHDWNRLATGWTYTANILEAAGRHLSDKQLARLAANPDELVGAWTYITFADRLPPKVGDELLARLRAKYSPMPAAEFKRLVADLDDDDFQTREAATAALTENHDRIADELGAAARVATSPEVTRRLRVVIAAGQRSPRATREDELLAELREHYRSPAHGRIIKALAGGRPGLRVVEQAKRLLQHVPARP